MKKILIVLFFCIIQIKSFGQDTSNISKFVNKWIGLPYRFGGETEKGIDCSAFVQRLYKDVFGLLIPRTCNSQFKSCIKIDFKEINIGDILFFNSKVSPSGWHCGVYIGNDEFIHAANYKSGVKISCLFSYSHLLKGVGRFK